MLLEFQNKTNIEMMGLQDVLEDVNCYAEDVLKTSSRRLQDQQMFAGLLLERVKPDHYSKLPREYTSGNMMPSH